MNATAPAHSKDEAALRDLIAKWSKALEAKDIDGLTANYSPDVVLFDLKPPYKVIGIDDYRELWRSCLPCFPASFKSEHRDLSLTVGQDVAYWHGLHHITPTDGKPHPAGSSWLRATVCYRKIAGKWVVTHEHVSLPYNPMTGMVVQIADPDSP